MGMNNNVTHRTKKDSNNGSRNAKVAGQWRWMGVTLDISGTEPKPHPCTQALAPVQHNTTQLTLLSHSFQFCGAADRRRSRRSVFSCFHHQPISSVAQPHRATTIPQAYRKETPRQASTARSPSWWLHPPCLHLLCRSEKVWRLLYASNSSLNGSSDPRHQAFDLGSHAIHRPHASAISGVASGERQQRTCLTSIPATQPS